MKNLSAIIISLLFTTVLFATANAQVSVTAAGNATSSVTPILQNVVVATVATGTCPNLLNSYHKIGSYGSEVVKLQNFLNSMNGAKLNGQGYFGPVTLQEVKNFQYTYGIKPTGYQHQLTTKMINDLNCGKVAKKARKVYMGAQKYISSNSGAFKPSTSSAISSANKDLVKDYQNFVKNIQSGTSTTATVTSATKTSFWENLNKDWNKIKDNYKAYLLVFALVLALFWFLRKAATE